MRDVAPRGIGWYGHGGGKAVLVCKAVTCRSRGDRRGSGSIQAGRRVINGTPPGVLFLVVRRCTRGVCFSILFAVGFCELMIGGALVMRGMVRMGVWSITLCAAIRASMSLTLCSS